MIYTVENSESAFANHAIDPGGQLQRHFSDTDGILRGQRGQLNLLLILCLLDSLKIHIDRIEHLSLSWLLRGALVESVLLLFLLSQVDKLLYLCTEVNENVCIFYFFLLLSFRYVMSKSHEKNERGVSNKSEPAHRYRQVDGAAAG